MKISGERKEGTISNTLLILRCPWSLSCTQSLYFLFSRLASVIINHLQNSWSFKSSELGWKNRLLPFYSSSLQYWVRQDTMEKIFEALGTTVRECTKGGENKAKRMLNAHGILLFGWLPPSQEIVKKAVATGEVVTDPLKSSNLQDKLGVFKCIHQPLSKNSITDAMKRQQEHYKSASTCTRKPNEPLTIFIVPFALPRLRLP